MDKIISTICFEGVVYIFTEFGDVYTMHRDVVTSAIQFRRVAKLELH